MLPGLRRMTLTLINSKPPSSLVDVISVTAGVTTLVFVVSVPLLENLTLPENSECMDEILIVPHSPYLSS